jgi:antitoxin ParD1/3/4
VAISADIGAKLEKYVAQLVAKGRYGSKSEVIREGIRLVQEREARLAALESATKKGARISPAVVAAESEPVGDEPKLVDLTKKAKPRRYDFS